MFRIRILSIIIFVIIITAQLFAQNKITISGKIVDDDNKNMPFVNVYILNSLDGAMTNESGEFSFSSKEKNNFTIIASMVGFKKYTKGIVLNNQKDIFLEIVLSQEIIELEEAIVTGSSFSSEKDKGIVVTPMDVYTTPGGAADIFQSLKTMPGLTQVSESAELYVRGGDPTETITIVDQATINHPFTFESAYGGIFSNINTSTFKNMYFSSGGFSVKYGNVLSGVLDIETKDEPLGFSMDTGFSMAAVSLNGNIPIIDNKMGLYFYSQQTFTKPIMWLNGNTEKFASYPVSKNIGGVAVYKYSNTGRIKLTINMADDKEGVEVENEEYNGIFNGVSNSKLFNIHHTDIIFGNLLIKNSISYNSFENHWKLGILDLVTKDATLKFRSDGEIVINKSTKLIGGIEVENRYAKYKGTVPKHDYDIRPEAKGSLLNFTLGGQRIAFYSEIQKSNFLSINKLFFVGGIRGDRITTNGLNWFDTRFSIGYKISENSTIQSGIGSFQQVPDMKLFSPEDGNPNLKAMKAIHYSFSYDLNFSNKNSFRTELYYKDYSNLPLKNERDNYTNDGFGFAAGADIILKGKLNKRIDGWISYGFINTKRKWLDFNKYTNSDFDITHNLAVVAKYSLSAMWQLGINYKYATGRPYTPIVRSIFHDHRNIYEPIEGAKNSERYKDYHRLDFRLTHLNQLFNKYFLVFYVEVLNILDINNIFGYVYNNNYSIKKEVSSYFGNRTIVFGTQISFN